jgi:hypothetical protein
VPPRKFSRGSEDVDCVVVRVVVEPRHLRVVVVAVVVYDGAPRRLDDSRYCCPINILLRGDHRRLPPSLNLHPNPPLQLVAVAAQCKKDSNEASSTTALFVRSIRSEMLRIVSYRIVFDPTK